MNYKLRPGVVMVRICDVNILAATREIWDQCPQIRPLPFKWYLGCSMMALGRSSEVSLRTISKVLGKAMEELHQQYDPIFAKLCEEGFLVPAEEET